MKKGIYCQYDQAFGLESSVGALRIYLPADKGYINFNIAHSVRDDRVCDTWRLSRAFAVDDRFENPYALTSTAEWDMALWIKDREDFIGGYMHGDEIFTDIKLFADGWEQQITSLGALTRVDHLCLQVESGGYDPADHRTEALKHFKEYIIDSDGIALVQRVQWLKDYELSKCYLAMMPPLKEVTDSYWTDADKRVRKIDINSFKAENCRSATLYGTESKLAFSMAVPEYPFHETGSRFVVTDNGGNPYNKMYFVVCKSGSVKCGEVWESRTEYAIHYIDDVSQLPEGSV